MASTKLVALWPFWMTENQFRLHFSLFRFNTQLSYFFYFRKNDPRRPFWMIENHFRSHFSTFQINTQLFFLNVFTKWPPTAILDDRKSLSITFFEINTLFLFFFFHKMFAGCRRPFWMTENPFRSHFSPFQINTQLIFVLNYFHKMAAGGHFE